MRRRSVAFVLVAVGVFAACGSSSKTASTGTTTVEQFSSPSYEKAKPSPSKSAKQVCQDEARNDISVALGIRETRVTTPTWLRADHLYSCTYVYPQGQFTLHVKEMSSAAETTAYFDSILRKYRSTQKLTGLGQGAWILKNNDVVVRKDYKVLLVDVQKLPATFGLRMTRSDVATNVAVVIMGCWTGA
jgi:hypothetical protein